MTGIEVQSYLLPKTSIVEVLTADGRIRQHHVKTCTSVAKGYHGMPMVLVIADGAFIPYPTDDPKDPQITRIWRRPGEEPKVIRSVPTLDLGASQNEEQVPAPVTGPITAVALQNYLLPEVSIVETVNSDGEFNQFTVKTCSLSSDGYYGTPMATVRTDGPALMHPMDDPTFLQITRIWRRPGDEPMTVKAVIEQMLCAEQDNQG